MLLLDYRINKTIEEYFIRRNLKYIKTINNKNLYDEISGHPDIVACNIGETTVLEKKTYDCLSDKLKEYNIVRGSATLKGKYPFDIAYNVVATDKYLIGNLNFVDEVVIRLAKRKNLKFINVKQGYTRCSTLVVNNDIFITSDTNIYNELMRNNIRVYYIKADDITLSKRYTGFLGGAGFCYKHKLHFFGNIEKNNFFEELKTILDINCIEYKTLFDGKLTDYGSAIEIYGKSNEKIFP